MGNSSSPSPCVGCGRPPTRASVVPGSLFCARCETQRGSENSRSILGLAIDLKAAILTYADRNAHMRSPFEDSFNSLEVNLLVDQLASFHPEECKEITARIQRWSESSLARDEGTFT